MALTLNLTVWDIEYGRAQSKKLSNAQEEAAKQAYFMLVSEQTVGRKGDNTVTANDTSKSMGGSQPLNTGDKGWYCG